jgi:hypothetical protein
MKKAMFIESICEVLVERGIAVDQELKQAMNDKIACLIKQDAPTCKCCGAVIKSQKVIDYCRNRKMDGIYCPSCQQAKGLLAKGYKVKEVKEVKEGYGATCVYCKTEFKRFKTQVERAEYNKKCVDKGYKGMICKSCFNAMKESTALVATKIEEHQQWKEDLAHNHITIQRDINEDKIKAKLIDTTVKAVDCLISIGYTPEQILETKIADLRAACKAIHRIVELNGNKWNAEKHGVVSALTQSINTPQETTPTQEEIAIEVPQEEVPTQEETVVNAPQEEVVADIPQEVVADTQQEVIVENPVKEVMNLTSQIEQDFEEGDQPF